MRKGNWIQVDEAVLDYLTESEQGENKFFKIWQIAFRGMDAMGLDYFYQIKSVKLNVESNKTVKLPPDYITYIKVGYLNAIGEVIQFIQNNKLSLFAGSNPDRLSKIQNDNYYFMYSPAPFFNNYWNGYNYVSAYGYNFGVPDVKPTFNIDETNQVIVFDPSFSYDNIILEYTASPVEGETYYFPRAFREALIAWMAWKDITSAPLKRSVNMDKAARELTYRNEVRLAKIRFKPFRIMEAYEQNLQARRLTVKE